MQPADRKLRRAATWAAGGLGGALALLAVAAAARRKRTREPAVPGWLKAGYAVPVPVIAAIYWREYGPGNYLWLSDQALAGTAVAAVSERSLPASMAAVGVLPLEIAWTADFLAGGRLLGLAAYMFDTEKPAYLRALSLFHLALPPTLLFLLGRLGYDRRALIAQTAVTLVVVPAAWLLTEPGKNVNWVHGFGGRPKERGSLLRLALVTAGLPLLAHAPMHLLLRRTAKRPEDAARTTA